MFRYALAIVLAVAVIGSTEPAAAATHLEPGVESASAQGDLIALINAYRGSNRLQQVSANGPLTAAAAWMAGDMAAKNYVGHVSSDGRSPTQRMSAFGYPATSMYTGEDLGAGYGTAGAVLAGWQGSPAHNAVLLNPNYDVVGIGLVYNPNSTYKWYWAADFGGPGETAKVVMPFPPRPQPVVPARPAVERAAPAPRRSDLETGEETTDPETLAHAARVALSERIGASRIAHLFAVLARMGAI